MGSYIINIQLARIDEQFWEILPAHRKIINDLLVEGVIEMYAISEDRSQGWMVIHAIDEDQARDIVDNLPIRDYFTYDLNALFILNNSVSLWPKVHLN